MITVTIEEKARIETIIKSCKVCMVGMIDQNNLPYVIPMNFGYKDEVIYMHSAPDSGCLDILERNPNVCITFCTEQKLAYQHEKVACSYRMKGSSVICRGKVSFVEDNDAKIEVLDILMKQYTERSFTYSDPAVRNVKIWKIEIESMSSKQFGAPNPNSPRRNYKDNEDF